MALKIDFDTDYPDTDNGEIIKIVNNVCMECALGYDVDLYAGVHLTGDEKIREINKEFRNIDNATDVLSFPLLEAKNGIIKHTELDFDHKTGAVMLGDIVISVEKAREQANDFGHAYIREIAFLTCHGMLHLFGYDHENKNDELIMIKKQKEVLDKLGYKKKVIE